MPRGPTLSPLSGNDCCLAMENAEVSGACDFQIIVGIE